MWTHAHVAEVQLLSPVGRGWKMDSDGRIIVDWIRDALPQQVVEVLSQEKSQETSANCGR